MCQWTWLWNWGRSFRFRQQNLCETPPSGEITMTSYPPYNKTSLSRKPCIPGKKVTIERYQEVMVALSEFVIKNRLKRPLAEKSRWRHIRLAMKPRYPGNHASQMKSYRCRYQEVMVALSESVMKIRLKRLLAEKSRWRHIRLSIKPRYLGNHASQIKSYYGTLSRSHGRTFRIRHVKSREALPGEEIMMTSFPAGKKTSVYRKPCIPDKKLLWNTMRKSWSLFQNPS